MYSFKSFLLSEGSRNFISAFHTSSKRIHSVDERPMFFSLNKKDADGWHRNSIQNHVGAYTYRARIGGSIARHDDKNVKNIFRSAGVNQQDYHNDLASNPSAEEIKNHPGTKALQAAGHHGYIYPDYDPNDFDKDSKALVSFDPSKHVELKKRQGSLASYKEN